MASDRKSPFEDVKCQSYLGSESLGEWLESKVNADRELSADVVGHEELRAVPDVNGVLEVSADVMGVESSELRMLTRGRAERSMVMFLCREISDANMSEIAGLFDVGSPAVSVALRRLKRRIERDDILSRRIDDLKREIGERLDATGNRGVA
jgi:chromosomal replication initiation ATPase DnaA